MVSWGGYDGTGPSGELRALDASQWKSVGLYKDQRVAEAGFVYDVKRDRFVWFGGGGGGPTRGETFVYSADKWSRLETPGPSARSAHVMVYDERRDRIVLFGGTLTDAEGRPVSNLGDTWEFDGVRWTRIAASGPSPRAAAGATYDNRRGLVILYGGDSQGDFSAETWAWDGTSWKKLADTGPAARGMGYLAYDSARDRVVLFGGRNGYPDGDLNDTWGWDGTRWQEERAAGRHLKCHLS